MDNKLIQEYKERITNEFIAALDEKGLNWKKSWVDNFGKLPESAYGKRYNILNTLILSDNMSKNEYFDNRYFTFKQAEKLGYKVKRGESACAILQKFPSAVDKNGKFRAITWKEFYDSDLLDDKIYDKVNVNPFVSQHIVYVFNAHQLDGIELRKNDVKNNDVKENISINLISKGLGVPIIERNQDNIFQSGCYYSSKDDVVYIPNKERFKSDESYSSTCLHELAHSTGHEKRLNRDSTKKYFLDDKERAKEELIAEITSAYVGLNIGVINNFEDDDFLNHKAYIKSWGKLLKEDKNLIFECFSQADKASEYMLKSIEKILNKEDQNSTDKSIDEIKANLNSNNQVLINSDNKSKTKEVLR